MKTVSKATLAKVANKHCESCRSELEDVLEHKTLTVYFQAIADLDGCELYGHLGTVLGPVESVHRSIDRYIENAIRLGEVERFSKRYFDAMLTTFAASDSSARLMFQVPTLLVEHVGDELIRPLEKALHKAGLSMEKVLLIHPGVTSMNPNANVNLIGFALAADHLGIPLAVGTLDCAYSDELIWDKVMPELTLLDEGQFYGVTANQTSIERLAKRIEIEGARGRRVLARGISSLNQLNAAMQAGAGLACGAFIGTIRQRPTSMISASAHTVIRDRCNCAAGEPDLSEYLLNRLWVGIPPVTPKHKAEEVYNMFDKSPHLRAVAVVGEGNVPMGLVSRYEMIDNMARPYRHELFGRKSCTRFMDPDALSMDVRTELSDLTEMVVNAPPHQLISGFIVTNNGRYMGIGSVQDLMREITAMQIKAAQHANPLTHLPGNVPIQRHIEDLLAARLTFVIAYCDLDNFKPFNDVFGYAMGDQIISLTANILNDCRDPELDFIGHVGGDDFILVFRSMDWEKRCQSALEFFDRDVRSFFNQDILDKGGYFSENRRGEQEFNPILSLSIGAVEVQQNVFENALAIATVATEAKKRAKALKGSVLYVNRRNYEPA
jgi:diguanylate cyclase (GGDEF)-like protein